MLSSLRSGTEICTISMSRHPTYTNTMGLWLISADFHGYTNTPYGWWSMMKPQSWSRDQGKVPGFWQQPIEGTIIGQESLLVTLDHIHDTGWLYALVNLPVLLLLVTIVGCWLVLVDYYWLNRWSYSHDRPHAGLAATQQHAMATLPGRSGDLPDRSCARVSIARTVVVVGLVVISHG